MANSTIQRMTGEIPSAIAILNSANITIGSGSLHLDADVVLDQDLQISADVSFGSVATDFINEYTPAAGITFNDDVIMSGDLTVNGTTTTINTATLEVEDQNIQVNVGGDDTSAQGAGVGITAAGGADDGYFRAGSADITLLELKAPNGFVLTLDVNADSTLLIEATSAINQDLSTDSTTAAFQTISVGQSDVTVRNVTGGTGTLAINTVVYAASLYGGADIVGVDAVTSSFHRALGVVTVAITDATTGTVRKHGNYTMDTTGTAFGDKVYADLSTSLLTFAPSPIEVGYVVVENSGTGEIMIDITESDVARKSEGSPTTATIFDKNSAREMYVLSNEIDMKSGSLDTPVVCTFTNGTDKVNDTSHGLANGTAIVFSTSGVLPAEITVNDVYYVVNTDTDDFEISTTKGGSTLDFTDDGTPTNNYHVCLIVEIDIPANHTFYVNHCGVIASTFDTVSVQPDLRWRATNNDTDFVDPTTITALDAVNKRENYDISTSAFTELGVAGGSTLQMEVNSAATATTLNGRAYFKGLLVENQ